jgi:hypothetical protein
LIGHLRTLCDQEHSRYVELKSLDISVIAEGNLSWM